MYTTYRSIRNIYFGFQNVYSLRRKISDMPKNLKISKILIVSKLTRYEYEQRRYCDLDDSELEQELRSRGSEFDSIYGYHELQAQKVKAVAQTLENLGIEVQIVNRFNYSYANVEWADIIMPTGGDGTFLLAASKVRNSNKPVIGINSDPMRSEGHLCLPKRYSANIGEAIERLSQGRFEWLLRSRIRTKITHQKGDLIPKYLHEVDVTPDLSELIREEEVIKEHGKVLPILALNEVFLGEKLSARVSHLKMKFNGAKQETNTKCSGVCICTGTGSTSWHISINRLSVQSVAELLRLMDIEATESQNSLATVLADIYNKNLIFDATENRIAYTIREMISAGVWPQPKGLKPRGFATKIEMRSCCYDAALVIDGGIFYPFNDGTAALFEIKPEDSLRTVILPS